MIERTRIEMIIGRNNSKKKNKSYIKFFIGFIARALISSFRYRFDKELRYKGLRIQKLLHLISP